MSKNNAHGQDRQYVPENNLLRATLEELDKTIPAAECTEKHVDGKMMEDASDRMTSWKSMHLTYAQFQEAMEKTGATTSPTVANTTASPSTPMPKAAMPVSTETLVQENMELRARLNALEMQQQQQAENFTPEAQTLAKKTAAKSSAAPKAMMPHGLPLDVEVPVQDPTSSDEEDKGLKRSRQPKEKGYGAFGNA